MELETKKMKNMRHYNILINKFRFFCLFLLCIFVTGTMIAQEKPGKKVIKVNVSLKVVDDNGTGIPKARVVVGEGMIHIETDENGSASFNAYLEDFVTISATGYEKNVSLVQEIIKNNTIKLMKSKLFMSSDDNIPLPYLTLKKRISTGSSTVIAGNQLERYPSTDLRNALTGLVTGLQVTERNGSPGLYAEEENGTYGITEKIGVSSRGSSMMYIIDDIPIDITEMPLDPQEIESVTIIKDIVGKAMYGPAAADGIILIKTKRGRMNERALNINIEDGVSVVDRMPGWTNGADYARLNNQARESDILDPLYSADAVDAYAKNDPYDKFHPSVNYKDLMLKNNMAFRRANISSSGGNDLVQYSSHLGYNGEGDIYKIGPTSDYNRLNARSNIDMTVNKFIKIQFDIYAGLTFRRSPNYGYATSESSTDMSLIEMNSVLTNLTSIPPIAFPVYANNDPSLKDPWFGVSSVYPINPIGNILYNGYYTETGRIGNAKAALDYDMSHFIKGLKLRTFFSFDALNLVRLGKAENYIAYTVTPGVGAVTGNDTITLAKVHDGVDNPNMSNLHDYYYHRYGFYENINYEKSFDNSNLNLSLTYFFNELKKNGFTNPQRQQNVVFTGIYSIKDKYSFQGVLNYAGSYSLTKYDLFPSLGASWVISEEAFMSNLKFINYLKLRAEGGVLGVESFMAPFYGRTSWTYTTGSVFGPYTTNRWFGTTTETTVSRSYPGRIGNPAIDWERAKEFSVGLDALLINHKLSLEINYFNNLRDGQISQLTNSIPMIIGVSSALPRFNFNKTRYFGLETGIRYTDNAGSLRYSIGGNATIMNSELLKYDEPVYRYDYQNRTGTAVDTYWGQTYIGKFGSDAEALVVPQVYDAILKTGDLKYKDMNDDGFIDDNDRSAIGHSSPRLFYSLDARISYRNFELNILGTGCAFYDIALTNSYYWNGWGDNNYSNFVKDNIGGAYPRLTYYKVNNNFVASDFWLTKGDYFKIQNVELAYNLPTNYLEFIRSRGARIFVRGANLVTISRVKDVDPESINSGVTVYPLFRTFTGGIKLTF
jgi:TonB-linked SusC/RagA family outer membrane protein